MTERIKPVSDMSMRERVARAIVDVEDDGISICAFFVALWEQRFSDSPDMEELEAIFLRMADAVLGAMREPTSGMIEAARQHDIQAMRSPDAERTCWTTMIDAAKAGA